MLQPYILMSDSGTIPIVGYRQGFSSLSHSMYNVVQGDGLLLKPVQLQLEIGNTMMD